MPRSSVVSRIAHETLLHSPSSMPDGLWWNHLESNFASRPEGFELGPWDWFRVSSTAITDIVVRTLACSLVTATALPTGYLPRLRWGGMDPGESAADWKLYIDRLHSGDPRSFFRKPDCPTDVQTSPPRRWHFRPENGKCVGLKFESTYEPLSPRFAKRYDDQQQNRFVRARYWRHNRGPRPTIIAVHGFMADPYWLNQRFFSLPWLYEQGMDVALLTLPHHGRRREPGSLFSGHGFFAEGIGGVNEHMGQAISDLRALMAYLRSQGAEKIGVTGVSLGGWTTALLASVEEDLEFAIPNVAVVSPVDLFLEWQPAAAIVSASLMALPYSVKDLRELLALTTPLTYQPKVPRERLMVIGGVGDRMAPPKHSRLLWDHWGRCRIHWFPGTHLVHLDRADYFDQMLSFMRSIDFV